MKGVADHIGGHAKTLMFVHINPETTALGETISTLKFAERVASIDLGAAHSNKEIGEIREYKEEISNLKLALEKKEAELQQLKSGTNIRGGISPLRVPKCNIAAGLKPETSQRTIDDTRSSEVRSCSSGKQRRSRLPAKFTDKDVMPKIPFLGEERSLSSNKTRSPSPPVRRSISTDRGAHVKSRLKPDTLENPPVMRLPFPARVSTNKSIAAVPAIVSSTDSHMRVYQGSQEPQRQDNISETLYHLQRVNSRRVLPEHEEEQFKQALNVRQGGIRKSKTENKVKAKQQQTTKSQKSDIAVTLLSDMDTGPIMEESRKSDFSEAENELGQVGLPVNGTTAKVKKLQRTFSRNSQNVEPREQIEPVESLFAGKQENKLPNGVLHNSKESSHSSIPEFRRSRSTPRGKFMLP